MLKERRLEKDEILIAYDMKRSTSKTRLYVAQYLRSIAAVRLTHSCYLLQDDEESWKFIRELSSFADVAVIRCR